MVADAAGPGAPGSPGAPLPPGPPTPLGPLASATTDLVAWLAGVVGAEVRVAPPSRTVAADAAVADPAPADAATADRTPAGPDAGRLDATPTELRVWPLQLGPDGQTRASAQLEPLRLRMRHLVSVAGGDTDLLDRALVAAAVAGEPTLVLDPPPAELWLAFGVPPRPVLLLDVAVRVDRPTATAPLVRQPLRVTSAPLRSLYGQVVGPGDLPLSGVRVEVTTTGAATYTDAAGRFSFASIPSDLPARLRLHGRNRHLTAEVATGSTGAVVIHCDLEES